ncbi:YopX family protein [Bacillus atrophaeus]|uniref:YopX family protein n=1 Tax=Bacillus atrophaeus TaxID=1452 RepID=UPI003816DCE3
MREIKFRAWHEKWNRLIYEIYLGDNEVKFPIGNTNDILDINEEYSNLIFQQYIGLKDTNGREIYEGDIIHCVHWFFDGHEIEEHFTASVGFRDGSFTLENINSRYYSDYTGEDNGKGICWIGDINYCEEDYEVIGNIYEDPELLEAAE